MCSQNIQLQREREMSFRSIVRDVRDGIGSLSRRSFDFKLSSQHKEVGRSRGSVQDCHVEQPVVVTRIQETPWANLPPELLRDVIKRLEESESAWPARKHVVACASVCRSWRDMCKEIVQSPELSGKITFPVSLKQVKIDSLILSTVITDLWLVISTMILFGGMFVAWTKRCNNAMLHQKR